MLLCVQSVALADLKITTTVAGGMTQTTYIKGKRQRTEMQNPAFTMATIQQCDLRRTVQLNDQTRKYIITPLDESGQPEMSATSGMPQGPQGPARRGAVVQVTMTVTDTGERKQVFGYTARHIKSKMVMDAPPEACNPGHSESEMDAWYIDLNVAFSCNAEQQPTVPMRPTRPGCMDQYHYKVVGSAKLGYPVEMGDTFKVTDISNATLDQSLFEIPQGYTQAASMAELMGMPGGMGGMAGMMTGTPGAQPPASEGGGSGVASAASSVSPKKPGTIRVGVAAINNRAGGGDVSLDSLRDRLVGAISGQGVEAVPLDASEQMAAEAEAKRKDCDLVLTTDLTALKQSAAGKIGGMFGRAAGIPTGGAEKYESRVDFKLYAVGGAAQLESNATAKEDGADASVGSALDKEAKAVAAASRKRH
jgi:hypothetical protein